MRSPGGCIGNPIMAGGGSSMRSPGELMQPPGDLIDEPPLTMMGLPMQPPGDLMDEPPPAMMGLPMQPPGDLIDNLMNMDLANLVDNVFVDIGELMQCAPPPPIKLVALKNAIGDMHDMLDRLLDDIINSR
eukprot:1181077-Prorocentrum_minimum.AAC.1